MIRSDCMNEHCSLDVRCCAFSVAGLIVLTVLDHVVRGDHNVTIVSGTASMGLVFIAFHFIASLFVTDHRQVRVVLCSMCSV